MKVFIDLGAYDGDTLKMALDIYSDFDLFVGFEPIPKLYDKIVNRFGNDKRFILHQKAAGIADERNVKLYVNMVQLPQDNSFIGTGSTLLESKVGTDDNNVIFVDVIDFSQYLEDNFSQDDFIILKIDIEGKEYDLIEYLIDTGKIRYIKKIFCEWHYKKTNDDSIHYSRHKRVVSKLNKLGFSVTGKNKIDEFSRIYK